MSPAPRVSLAAAAIAITTQVAEAAPRAARGLDLVPAGAAAVLRADPAELERAAALIRSFGGDVGIAANLVSLAMAGWLGFDPLARAGWRSIGIDAEQPVFVSLARVDPTAPRALWHVQVIARVADSRQFAGWAGRIPLAGEPWRAERAERGRLAPLLGLGPDARAEAAAARALTARGAVSVGAIRSLGALIVVRRAGAHAVVDAFAPAVLAQLSWASDGDRILEGLTPPGAGAALSDRATPALHALDRPGLVVWTHPAGLLDSALTWSRPPVQCDPFRDLAPRTALMDAAASLRIAAHQIGLEILWSAAPGAPLGAAWPAGDDGLLGPPARAGAILTASIYLAGTARLRQLPRPALIEGGWGRLWHRARRCGRGMRAVLVGFAWPELAAQWLAEAAASAPQAAVLVGALRNVGLAARRISAGDRRGWQAAIEGSLAPGTGDLAGAMLDVLFGPRRAERRPRPHAAWDGRFLNPYTLSRGPRGAVVGVAIGDGARRWRLEQPLTRPRRATALARAAGNASALLAQLAPGLPARAGAVAAAAAARLGAFDAAVTVQPDAIRATLTLRRR